MILLWVILSILLVLIATGVISVSIYRKNHYVYYQRPRDDELLDAIEREGRVPVVFSLTTLPSRMGNLENAIRGLLKQTILSENDKVVVNIPRVSRREKVPYIIPKGVQELAAKDKRVVLNTNGEDAGPISKILDTLRVIRDPEARIFPVDDDCTFPPEYFEELLWYSIKDPSKAYGYHGLYTNSEGYYKFAQEHYGPVPVVETVTGVVYVRSMFTDEIFNTYSHGESCFFTDDVVLSHHVTKNGAQPFLLQSTRDYGHTRGRLNHPLTMDMSASNPLSASNLVDGAMDKYVGGEGHNYECIKKLFFES